MKKRFFLITIIIIISTSFIFFLAKNKKTNGFERIVIRPEIKIREVLELPRKSFRFVSNSDEKFILFDYKNPFVVYRLDSSLKKLNKTNLLLIKNFDSTSNYIKFDAFDNNIFLSNTDGDLIVSNDDQFKSYKLPLDFSDQGLAVSPTSLAVRWLKRTEGHWNIDLVKLKLNDSIHIQQKHQLPIRKNALFTNDGQLKFDKNSHRFIYSFTYFGEFLCLDTNMNLLYRAKTIDTVRTPKIILGTFDKKLKNGKKIKQVTQIAPPTIVNKYFTINKDRIYLVSGLKSDNKNDDKEAIDVYSIKDGSYLHSFYIPKYRDLKLRGINVGNDRLLAIFDTSLVMYSFKENR